MLQALQQQQQQTVASPVFSVGLPSQSDFVIPSHKRTRSTSPSPPHSSTHLAPISPDLASPPIPPPVLPLPLSTAASPISASLFGDDPFFAGLLENATFTNRPLPHPSPPPDGFLPCHFPSPPLDWGLHSHVRFTSTHPFDWCTRVSQADHSAALRAFILRSASSPSTPLPPSLAFASSLLYYHHPAHPLTAAHPLTPHLIDAQSSPTPSPYDKRCLLFTSQRWMEWEQSFRSLYYQLRQHHLHHFYLVHHHHTVLFLQSTNPSSAPSAVLSRSTAALRSTLTALRVQYTAPYQKAAEAKVGGLDDDIGRLPKGVRVVSHTERREEDGLLSSLLVVTGREDVHGLFDALLNLERKGGEDVPVLLSSSPFLHATLASLTVSSSSSSMKVGGKEGVDGGTWSVEVKGWLLPEAVLGMMRAMVGEGRGERGGMEGAEWSARLWKEEEGSGTSGNLNSVMSIQAMARCDGSHGDAAAELAASSQSNSPPPPCIALCHDEQVHAALLRTLGSAEVSARSQRCYPLRRPRSWRFLTCSPAVRRAAVCGGGGGVCQLLRESPPVSAIRYAGGEFRVQLRDS